ncbi:MAG: NADP-dependent phosphogluconate dehydrogenase [Candidatus Humimicrobiaceae bacterium]
MIKKTIGLIGLAVMGENLALNIESKGYSLAVYNRTFSKSEDFVNSKAKGENIAATYSLEEFVANLESPKIIILMVKAGSPVDEYIEKLIPLLNKGDLIIDGGNSYFKDTIRRNEKLSEKGILYIGTGISGGEEGALKGPAIMPGGQIEAYNLVKDLFNNIAGKAEDGIPCVSYIGPNGSGHFVKMVHNGIEYGDMQLIGECVWTLKNALGLSAKEISDIMLSWSKPDDVLCSYLIEITGKAMREKDKESDQFLVDRTADITRMKGTGTWTVQSGLELLVPIPTITSAVFSREMSEDKNLRLAISEELIFNKSKYNGERDELVNMAHDALYIAKISSYAQGFALLKAASKKYAFNLNLGKIAEGWRAGCIIRAQFLNEITKGYEASPNLSNLLAVPKFKNYINQNLDKLASFINIAHSVGVPAMAIASAYDYIIQIASPVMISAQVSAQQRDFFGAHGYFKLKKDSPEVLKDNNGNYIEYHTEWMEEGYPEKLL